MLLWVEIGCGAESVGIEGFSGVGFPVHIVDLCVLLSQGIVHVGLHRLVEQAWRWCVKIGPKIKEMIMEKLTRRRVATGIIRVIEDIGVNMITGFLWTRLYNRFLLERRISKWLIR